MLKSFSTYISLIYMVCHQCVLLDVFEELIGHKILYHKHHIYMVFLLSVFLYEFENNKTVKILYIKHHIDLYGLSPVCFLRCFLRDDEWQNSLPQTSHS